MERQVGPGPHIEKHLLRMQKEAEMYEEEVRQELNIENVAQWGKDGLILCMLPIASFEDRLERMEHDVLTVRLRLLVLLLSVLLWL